MQPWDHDPVVDPRCRCPLHEHTASPGPDRPGAPRARRSYTRPMKKIVLIAILIALVAFAAKKIRETA